MSKKYTFKSMLSGSVGRVENRVLEGLPVSQYWVRDTFELYKLYKIVWFILIIIEMIRNKIGHFRIRLVYVKTVLKCKDIVYFPKIK